MLFIFVEGRDGGRGNENPFEEKHEYELNWATFLCSFGCSYCKHGWAQKRDIRTLLRYLRPFFTYIDFDSQLTWSVLSLFMHIFSAVQKGFNGH